MATSFIIITMIIIIIMYYDVLCPNFALLGFSFWFDEISFIQYYCYSQGRAGLFARQRHRIIGSNFYTLL